MPTASTGPSQKLPSDREGFLRQLPQRMAAIEENWSDLKNQAWSTSTLEKLYGRVREVSEASSRFGLRQLNENVFSVEVYLSSFVGVEEKPGDDQVEAIEGLLRNLRSAANSCTEGSTQGAAGKGQTVYLLGNESETVVTELSQAFKSLGTPATMFSDTDELTGAMDHELPVAVVVSTTMLPKMSSLTAELVRLKSQTSLTIPLIFVSTSSTLQLRVDAIRAGSDAYFVAPFDADEVALQIIQSTSPLSKQPYRIMVVEDDPTQAEFAASILRKADMEVTSITEPMRVLDVLRSFKPDLILMDIYMPEINGLELTTIIREYNEFVGIPIVFLSGEQNADKQLDALSVGGDDFVAKPIRPKHLLAVVKNRVRRSRRMRSALGESTAHDRLTGLLTRQRFIEQVARAVEADPMHAQPAGVLVLSPDGVQQLQQSLGMGGLDHLMSELAEAIRGPLEDNDAAARLDDQQIGILVKRSSNNQINDLAVRLLEQVDSLRFSPKGEPIELSIGIGVCLFDENLDDASGLVNRAGAALQKAQQQGPRQTHIHTFADEVDGDLVTKEDDLTATIRHCLVNDGFVVRYQPMLDLQTRGSENYEVLLRMPAPSGDLLHERNIREPADKAGLAGDIDRWLLERAIAILKQRREYGRQTHIFVHQSASSLIDSNHPAWLLGRLRSQQMVGTGLVLDFRVADLSQDIKAAQQNIAALRDFDVEVSLSRFPEKPAAFKVLRFVRASYISVAPRLLKADRSIISDVINQSHKIGAKVIVPNIDDPRSIDLHWSSGADYLQGNFIQRPLDNMDYDFSQVVI